MEITFVDCGAHKGQSIIKAREIYGENIQVHSFEIIPLLTYELNKIYEKYNNIIIYNKGVWIEDTIKEVHISRTKASWGNSLYNRFNKNDTIKIKVDCIDFCKWVKDNINPNNYNILKLDIEGCEYEVLNKLMDLNLLEYFNDLVGEWHHDKINNDVKSLSLTTPKRLYEEYGIDMKVWEAPWYSEDTFGMVTFSDKFNSPEQWANWKNKIV